MKNTCYILFFAIILSCSKSKEYDAVKYFKHINNAELAICNENYEKAISEFEIAINAIEKPFGKDVFNLALSSQLLNDFEKRDKHLQEIINNSNELDFVKSVFVNQYITEQEWNSLMDNREIKYNQKLRTEFNEIYTRDQLFRPMYETHDDTINSNRKINLQRILELTYSSGFPSQVELGYDNYLRNQPHDIVLHHTAQRRSYDKTVIDLEPILKSAVTNGRFDPEQAVYYLNLQNDQDKGKFQVYSSWQFKHPLLPDSLNNKIWFPKLSKEQTLKVDAKRKEWFANSISEIKTKVNFLNESGLPFIFSSVRKSLGNMPNDFDKDAALEQYRIATSYMLEN